jgi:hypothetical protein
MPYISSDLAPEILHRIFGAGGQVVGAVADVEVDVAVLVRAAVALVVHGPGVEAVVGEPVHGR